MSFGLEIFIDLWNDLRELKNNNTPAKVRRMFELFLTARQKSGRSTPERPACEDAPKLKAKIATACMKHGVTQKDIDILISKV